ncbi:MAG TPA: thioesterase family protein [Clostridia bacterium]|nr:thioesterase family protein [Clostridia bacterium]
MTHTWTTQVRSYELDMHRHVNNATYLNYFEAARMNFLSSIGFDYAMLLEKGFSLFVAKIEAHYKAPALLNDEIYVTTQSSKRKRYSGVFRQIVYRAGTELCRADITWACVNSEGKPVPLPEEFELPELQPGDKDITI